MPLINLKTDLKSLKFGKGSASDKPGGGFSNQPYITTPLPSDDSDPSTDLNTAGPDSLLRGGLTAPIRAITDVSRLTEMFFDTKSPNGLLFTIKQNILSRNSVKTEASIGVGTAGGTVNQGVYLPASTILQAGVGFLGSHLNLLGVNPFAPMVGNDPSLLQQRFQGGLVKYESAAKFNNRAVNNFFSIPGSTTTRQVTVSNISEADRFLREEAGGDQFNQALGSETPDTITRPVEDIIPGVKGKFDNRLLNIWDEKQNQKSKNKRDRVNILSYGGGPGSLAGIGRTHIKFADQRTGVNNPLSISNPSQFTGKSNGRDESLPRTRDGKLRATIKWNLGTDYLHFLPTLKNYENTSFSVYKTNPTSSDWTESSPNQYVNNSSTYNQEQIIAEPLNVGRIKGQPTIQDFRKTLIADGSPNSTLLSLAPGYNGLNAKNIENRLSLGDPGKQNDSPSYTVGNNEALDSINYSGFYASKSPNLSDNDDLVKLSIGILKNDGTGDSTYMHFRSFINSFSDNYTADWGDVQYVGRGDKFYNYKGFVRSISMGWTVYAQSKQELIPMYEKLNYLASSLAPDYSWGGYMRGNLARLTVGGYLYNQLGIIKSITYDIPSESTWEIGIDIDANTDHSVKELPHMIKVTGFTFIPIENKIPQIRNHFIHLKNSSVSTKHYQSYPTKGTQPKQNPTLAQATAITNEAKASADREARAQAEAAIKAAAEAGANNRRMATDPVEITNPITGTKQRAIVLDNPDSNTFNKKYPNGFNGSLGL